MRCLCSTVIQQVASSNRSRRGNRLRFPSNRTTSWRFIRRRVFSRRQKLFQRIKIGHAKWYQRPWLWAIRLHKLLITSLKASTREWGNHLNLSLWKTYHWASKSLKFLRVVKWWSEQRRFKITIWIKDMIQRRCILVRLAIKILNQPTNNPPKRNL